MNILKETRINQDNLKFSVIVPTWNNLEFLKILINSIRKNSYFKHQIIIHINQGLDGTLNWVKEQNDLNYVYSEKNLGICYALNNCRSMVKTNYILYINDDMYVCPDWDFELDKEIKNIGHNYFYLSSTMIEPFQSSNSCVIVKNFGTDPTNFDEGKLLQEYKNLTKEDWYGSTWPPNIVHRDIWDMVGGLSIEYTPGFYSDPDFSRKLWEIGVRVFKGLGKSKVYHFGSKSTKRYNKSDGKKIFLIKWGITSKTFTTQYLKMGKKYNGELKDPQITFFCKLKNKLKRIKSIWGVFNKS